MYDATKSNDKLYLIPEAEPYLSACTDWLERYQEYGRAAFALAASIGAAGFFPNFDHEVIALTMVDPIPSGWARAKIKGRGAPRLVPAKGAPGDKARALLTALPPMPKWNEIAALIGHPCQIKYCSPESGSSGFSTCGVGFWSLVNITWAGDNIAILAKDPQPQIAVLRNKYPDVIIENGDWSPPVGLRSISKARWNLLVAQAEVDSERAVISP